MLNSYLTQHVIDPASGKNISNFVFSTKAAVIEKLEVLEHLKNSDNSNILWELECDVHVEENKQTTKHCFKVCYVSMRTWFESKNWSIEFLNLDTNGNWGRC